MSRFLAIFVTLFVCEPDAVDGRFVALQSQHDRAALPQVVYNYLLVLPIHIAADCQRVAVGCEVDTA